MAIPPGVSAHDFERALKEFRAAVGVDWVFTNEEDVALYRDAYSPLWGEPEERRASAAVAPDSVEQVQAVLRCANKYRIPMYAVSTGKNLGYGGSAPNYSGSVVLDLKRMDRILEVDDKRHFAVVEPGVSYFDLYRYIQERNLAVWIDVPDPGWGSVVGNALDHGTGYTGNFYRSHFDAHCGMEVVLANGELLQVGLNAVPGARTGHECKTAFGPMLSGLFAQGNYGVVTKMGFWLMPRPTAYLAGTVAVPKYADLIPLMDELNYLENIGVFNGAPTVSTPLQMAPLVQRSRDLATLLNATEPPIPAIERYLQASKVPFWTCRLQFYGPAKAIAVQWECAKERFASIRGATFQDGPAYELPLKPEEESQVNKPTFGIPNLAMFSLGARSELNPTPTNGHVWFSPAIPRSGEIILEAQKFYYDAGRELGFPIQRFPQWLLQPTRTCVFMFTFAVTHDVEKNRRTREVIRHLVQMSAERGWAEIRTSVFNQDLVMSTYSANGHAFRRVCETIKDAMDPNGILAAGRSGIWPKHLREKRA